MKRLFVFLAFTMLVSIVKAQSLYEINSHVGSNTEKINTSIIDSITYEISDDSYNQIH